jgi:plasmid stabilization system protein ParE
LKRYAVRYASRAARDLLKVREDVLEASASEAVANEYLKGILDAAESLREAPERFPAWRLRSEFHFVYFKKYLIFYRITQGEVVVAHIRYAGRRPFGS